MFRLRLLLAVLVTAFASPPAHADELWHYVSLSCDPAHNRAMVRISRAWNDDAPNYPGLSPALDHGLSRLPVETRYRAPLAYACTLADGREVRVRHGIGQAFAYGMGGGDAPEWFSLWVGGRKVLSRFPFHPGRGTPFPKPDCPECRLHSIIIDGDRIRACRFPDEDGHRFDPAVARGVTCEDLGRASRMGAPDPLEYPPRGARQQELGSIRITSGADNPICRAMVAKARQPDDPWIFYVFDPDVHGFDNMLWKQDTVSLRDVPHEFPLAVPANFGKIELGQYDFLNSGKLQFVVRFRDDTHYFDGDVFLVTDRLVRAEQAILLMKDQEFPYNLAAAAKANNGFVFDGPVAGYEDDQRYTHFKPFRSGGARYLIAWPTAHHVDPTAMVLKPTPAGTLGKVCVFQRVRPNY